MYKHVDSTLFVVVNPTGATELNGPGILSQELAGLFLRDCHSSFVESVDCGCLSLFSLTLWRQRLFLLEVGPTTLNGLYTD